jgi:hypothetical protein
MAKQEMVKQEEERRRKQSSQIGHCAIELVQVASAARRHTKHHISTSKS